MILAVPLLTHVPAPEQDTLPFDVATDGDVSTDVEAFAAHVSDTLDDPRGWTLGGTIEYPRVAAGAGLFTVVLASPDAVEAAAPICDDEWSCRVGDRVLINEDRWLGGTVGYPLPLDDYRHYVVNHEVGHWLGLDHRDCPGFGQEAPVMMQQSKSVGQCRPTVWPVPDEQREAADIRGAELRRQQVLSRGDRGAGVAEWQQHLNEVAERDLAVDGWFGPNTEAATIDFQRFLGLTPDGVAGGETRGVMNYVLRRAPRLLTLGMRGPDVSDWQRDLRQIAGDIVVDGWFGPQTRQRTIDFQRFFGLPETGVVDDDTRSLADYLLSQQA